MTTPNPSVSSVDQLATHFRTINARLASLERASSSGTSSTPITGVSAGVIQSTIRSTPDTGFLFLQGQTIVGGQTLYPDLWAVIPASWKSGANIVFPDARSRMLIGDDAAAVLTLGALAGASTVALASGNLPPHIHAINHDHPSTALSLTDPGHNHTQNPHTHSDTPGTARIVVGGTATGVLWNGGTNSNGNFVATPNATATNIANTTGISGSVDLPNFVGNSGDGGFANTPVTLPTPPSLVVNWQIKT